MTTIWMSDISGLNDEALFFSYFSEVSLYRQDKVKAMSRSMDKMRSLGVELLGKDNLKIARRFFAEREQDYIMDAEGEEREKRLVLTLMAGGSTAVFQSMPYMMPILVYVWDEKRRQGWFL